MTVIWIYCAVSVLAHAVRWFNGIPPEEDIVPALQIAAVVAVVLTIVIPLALRAVQKGQRERGESETKVVHIFGLLVVLALIAYGTFWMLTQS